MQKKIIALALATLAGSAFAQSNVTVYGVVDMSESFVKSSGSLGGSAFNQSTVGRLDSNSSHIGFKGVEDLGNGLKAVFQYETGFDASTAGALAGGRDTYVGLAGGFGTVAAGTLTHPLRAMGARVELAPGATGLGTTMSVTGTVMGTQTGADNRAANAIAYISPNFSGFTATVAYVNGELKTNNPAIAGQPVDVNTKQWQVAGQYENGPLWVAAGYHKASDIGLTGFNAAGAPVIGASTSLDTSIMRLAATYTLPTATKLTALFDRTKTDIVGGGWAKRNAWSLGAAQGFGKNTVGLEYGRANKTDTSFGEVADSDAHIWTALYTYELSKRTMVQARYSKLTNGANVNNGFYINPVANGANTTANVGNLGADYTGFLVGLRHSF